jgi:hypothetical protein
MNSLHTTADIQEQLHEDLKKLKEAQDQVSVDIDESTRHQVQALLLNIQEDLKDVMNLLAGSDSEADETDAATHERPARRGWKPRKTSRVRRQEQDALRVVEGVFDGEHMIGPEGKKYLVPPNYASKSKLVEGDILKLIIGADGDFTYKQISPIERKRLMGVLVYEPEIDHYFVQRGSRTWKLLRASVTYFNGQQGDEVIFSVPQESMSSWAAVENIINGGSATDYTDEKYNEDEAAYCADQFAEESIEVLEVDDEIEDLDENFSFGDTIIEQDEFEKQYEKELKTAFFDGIESIDRARIKI